MVDTFHGFHLFDCLRATLECFCTQLSIFWASLLSECARCKPHGAPGHNDNGSPQLLLNTSWPSFRSAAPAANDAPIIRATEADTAAFFVEETADIAQLGLLGALAITTGRAALACRGSL